MIASIESFFNKYIYTESIRSHLLYFFVLLVFVPTAATSLTSAVLGWQNGRQRAIDQLQLAAKFKTSEIESWTHTLTNELYSVLNQGDAREIVLYMLRLYQQAEEETSSSEDAADAIELPTGLVTELEWRFQRHIEQPQTLENLFLVTLKGKMIASNLQPKGKIDVSGLYFQKALEGPYAYFAPLDQTTIVVGIPIFEQGQGPGDPDYTILGVLVGQASTETLDDIMLAQTELGETGETYLVNQDYVPITPLKFADELDQSTDVEKVTSPGSRRAIEDHEDGSGFYRGYQGRPVVGVYRWLPEMEVALLAEQSRSEAFRAIYQTLGINLGVAILAVVGAVITATFIAQRIATPLVNLSEAATKVADGDLEQRAEVEGKQEIRMLARAFNRMTTRLREMLRSEEVRRVELEREIADREKAEAEREQLLAEQAALQQEVIEAQREALRDLSTPIIPIMEIEGTGSILVMPLIGSIDTMRARDIMRSLLAGINKHHAGVVILDITGVPVVDSGVADHLNKTIQAARLKGTRTIVTGISDAVAEAIVDLGIDWGEVTTLSNLKAGLRVALAQMGRRIE
jgi:anti-anti-sigma regulatory factor/HAMP domain-containing protein